MQEREEQEQQEEQRRKAYEAEMARLDREAKEREKQRLEEEHKEIQRRHAKERIEQLRKSEMGAKFLQNIDEEVQKILKNIKNYPPPPKKTGSLDISRP